MTASVPAAANQPNRRRQRLTAVFPPTFESETRKLLLLFAAVAVFAGLSPALPRRSQFSSSHVCPRIESQVNAALFYLNRIDVQPGGTVVIASLTAAFTPRRLIQSRRVVSEVCHGSQPPSALAIKNGLA